MDQKVNDDLVKPSEDKPARMKPIDVAAGNTKNLTDFITNSLQTLQSLKIEPNADQRIAMLERIASQLVHIVNPLVVAVGELEAKVDELEQRITHLEADAEQGLLSDYEVPQITEKPHSAPGFHRPGDDA